MRKTWKSWKGQNTKKNQEQNNQYQKQEINNPKNKDPWEIDEIKQFKSDAINEIYDHIMKLSGVEITEADVKQFPENE